MKKILYVILVIAFSSTIAKSAEITIFAGPNDDPVFVAASVTVNVGDTITWVWMGTNLSFCTESTSIPVGAQSWSEPLDINNFTFSMVVTIPGLYEYECSQYPGMVGQVNVTGSGCPPLSNALINGQTTICQGSWDTLTASATNATSYQWVYNGVFIANATLSYYYAGQAGTYSCIGYNSCGDSLQTSDLNVSVNSTPTPIINSTNNGSTYNFNATGVGVVSWNWNFGDQTTSTQQNPQHTFSAGTYTVVLSATGSNGCIGKDTVIITVGSTVVGSIAVESLPIISPNPASKQIDVYIEEDFELEIFDMVGRRIGLPAPVVHMSDHRTYDVSRLPAGNYIIEISGYNRKIFNKLSIVR